uniref:Nucleic-acid-binding protein n=1 Tax=Schizaphis graminum TaxID=13262 RepID=A0A2S2PJR9_SCHGA
MSKKNASSVSNAVKCTRASIEICSSLRYLFAVYLYGFVYSHYLALIMSFQSNGNGSKNTNKRNLSSSSLSPTTVENNSKFFCTPNRFSTLAKDVDADNNSSTNIGQNHKSSVTPNPPPVYIKNVSNISTFTSGLLSILKSSDFICKSTPSHLIVRTNFREHYNLLVEHLTESNVSFHTYQPKAIHPLRVVIRNLHPTTSHEDIIAGLSDLGHHVSNVHNIKRFSDKTPLPLFFVDIKTDTNNPGNL